MWSSQRWAGLCVLGSRRRDLRPTRRPISSPPENHFLFSTPLLPLCSPLSGMSIPRTHSRPLPPSLPPSLARPRRAEGNQTASLRLHVPHGLLADSRLLCKQAGLGERGEPARREFALPTHTHTHTPHPPCSPSCLPPPHLPPPLFSLSLPSHLPPPLPPSSFPPLLSPSESRAGRSAG
jgi:hypothetical protein